MTVVSGRRWVVHAVLPRVSAYARDEGEMVAIRGSLGRRMRQKDLDKIN